MADQANIGARWICAQIGARQRYMVPRSLHRIGALELLITDAWYRPGHILTRNHGIAGRYNATLADADVYAPNPSNLLFESIARINRKPMIKRMMARNQWFQSAALRRLRQVRTDEPRVLMSFSYASRDLFRYARERGWRTVLDQIDPGPFEERLVVTLEGNREPHFPPDYWDQWREECELSDVIVVNSAWSRDALVGEGIPADKLRVLPLVYEGPHYPTGIREYPAAFSAERPMRVLFLGQVIARKGVGPLLDAAEQLRHLPIRFDLVGQVGVQVPRSALDNPMIRFHGSVPHQLADRYYADADVFILPTFSDGFAITQAEARHMKVPVIASRHCGDVVDHGVNGLLLDEVSASAITAALRRCLDSPAMLARFAAAEGHSMSEAELGHAWVDAARASEARFHDVKAMLSAAAGLHGEIPE